MISNSDQEWGAVAKGLHWIMAILIVVMFVLGWLAVSYPLSPMKLQLFIWHKSIGLTLLALLIVRLTWRAFNPVPSLPDTTSRAEHVAARLSHTLLYGLMILMPVSGYIISSTANFPFRWFGWIQVPNIIPPNENWQHNSELVHLVLFWLFAPLVVLHIVAALWHHRIKRNDVLTRMLPGKQR